MLRLVTTWRNDNPETIWNRLARKLGREPTHAEAKAEMHRILELALCERAAQGKLSFQRKR